MTSIPITETSVPNQRVGETVETSEATTVVDLALAQADAINNRDEGFHQVPVQRRGQWGVLRRTPHAEDFIPTRSLDQAIAIVTSPVVC